MDALPEDDSAVVARPCWAGEKMQRRNLWLEMGAEEERQRKGGELEEERQHEEG
jgi:hypothetical protein